MRRVPHLEPSFVGERSLMAFIVEFDLSKAGAFLFLAMGDLGLLALVLNPEQRRAIKYNRVVRDCFER